MKNIVRTVAATIIASSFLLPATAVTASAQSSLSSGSSSFDFGSSGPEEPIADPLEVRLEVAYERLITAKGFALNADQELEATGLLNRAFAGEFQFEGAKYYGFNAENNTAYWIDLFTEEEVEEIMLNIEADIKSAEEGTKIENAKFGLEVGKLGDYYYIAGVEKYEG